jgi:hypothetical protein
MLREEYGVNISRFKLSVLLKGFNYRYMRPKISFKDKNENQRLVNQQEWCRKFIYYRDVLKYPVYFLDESSINMWAYKRSIWM